MNEKMDRLIIRTMRSSIVGIFALGVVFVCYIVTLFATSAHDNARIDRLEDRVRTLEDRRGHGEAPTLKP